MSWNTTAVRELRRTLVINEQERALVIGCVLGDGSLAPTVTGQSFRLQIVHGSVQKTYIGWKYGKLKRWTLSPPAFQTPTNSWRFRTISHPTFTELARRFYIDGRKRIPTDIIDDLRHPLTMATWFMDDGCRYPQGSLVLNTHCFDGSDHAVLQRALRDAYGIRTTLQRNHGRTRIYIPVAYARRLIPRIASRILPVFDYKIGWSRRDFAAQRSVMVGAMESWPA